MRPLLLVAAAAFLAACSGEQRLIRDGTLRADIGQDAFAEQWGFPERTLSVVNEEQLRARWGRAIPADLFHEHPLDLWVYPKPPAELVFDDGKLVAWKTEESAAQLQAISVPPGNRFVGNERHSLYKGLLRVGIGQSTFRSAWGRPDRMTRAAAVQELETQWGPGLSASVLQGHQPLDVWVYEKRGVELLFDDGDLAAWKTERTVKDLAAVPTGP
ncbi:MAG TPA: hypothetical protein VIE44_08605 [Methylomirabilota bacterium]